MKRFIPMTLLLTFFGAATAMAPRYGRPQAHAQRPTVTVTKIQVPYQQGTDCGHHAIMNEEKMRYFLLGEEVNFSEAPPQKWVRDLNGIASNEGQSLNFFHSTFILKDYCGVPFPERVLLAEPAHQQLDGIDTYVHFINDCPSDEDFQAWDNAKNRRPFGQAGFIEETGFSNAGTMDISMVHFDHIKSHPGIHGIIQEQIRHPFRDQFKMNTQERAHLMVGHGHALALAVDNRNPQNITIFLANSLPGEEATESHILNTFIRHAVH
jgi:hypothetical protein